MVHSMMYNTYCSHFCTQLQTYPFRHNRDMDSKLPDPFTAKKMDYMHGVHTDTAYGAAYAEAAFGVFGRATCFPGVPTATHQDTTGHTRACMQEDLHR